MESRRREQMTDPVLIIGASGFLGRTLLRSYPPGGEVWGTWHSRSKRPLPRLHSSPRDIFLDITNPEQVEEVIGRINPGIILLSAALADIDRCETDRHLALNTNVRGAENVVRCCRNRLLVYYSTNAVFDGFREDCREEDQPRPINFYGETKWKAEAIIQNLPQHLILRTAMLYTDDWDGPKFINWLIRNLSQGTAVKAATDFIMNPTFIHDLATATFALLQKKCRGLYHVAGGSTLSCYEMALQIVPKWGFDPSLVQPVTRAELPWRAPRPEKASLNIEKLKNEGINMLTFEQGLEKVWEASREAGRAPASLFVS